MSREIKFRAWNEKTKRFTKDSDNAYLSRNDSGIICEQYTGLKDEDGKEIYEGDIVTLNCYWEEVEPRDCCVITFEDGCFRVGDAFENEAGKYLKEYRLAGNIHENPDLLFSGEDE